MNKKISLWLCGLVVCVWGSVAQAQSCGQSPVNPVANIQAKNLLCYLKNNRFISGQTDMADADQVQQWTGRYPAIVAFDFYRYTDGDTSETQRAIDFAKTKKGIVAFQWHWKCPRGGEYYTDCPFDVDINDPEFELYQDIDLVGRELKKLSDAGVPVMFRPLHESNDNYMWWAKKGADNYKRLWRLMYDRINAQGANNLVWVFNGMANTAGYRSPMSNWYPGDNLVDVVSSDYYQSWADYNTLKAIGTNKIVGVSETFNALNPASEPPFSFSVVWAFRDCYSVQGQPSSGDVKGCQNSWRTAMANNQTISIEKVPDFNVVGDPGPVNLVIGKSVTASSVEGAGYEAAKAVDNNTSTRWASTLTAATATYTIDLGAYYSLSGVRLNWEAAYATAYNIQVSSDGVNYSAPVYNKIGAGGGVENITLSAQGRYVRLNMTSKINASWGYSLWEVAVFGVQVTANSSSSVVSSLPSSVSSTVSSVSSSRLSSAASSSVTSSVASSASSSASLSSVASPLTCSVAQTGSWQGGYQLDVKVTNTGAAVNGWTVYLLYSQPAQITSSWNATLVGNGTNRVAATNVSYNASLVSGGSTTFGLAGNTPVGFTLPQCVASSPDVTGSSSNAAISSSAGISSKMSSAVSSFIASSSLSSVSSVQSSSRVSSAASSLTGDYQGIATHFDSFGIPYGGCGIPQDKLETQNFVALNVYNTPGNYAFWPRPLVGANLQYLGEFNNGKNCGRWVRVTIQEDCNGLNDGAQNQPFCRGGTGWFNDGKQEAELDMLVADSCGDDNAWCRDSRYHLDLATGAVTNQFLLRNAPVVLLPDNFNNRKIRWHYVEAPNYQGDVAIYFMQGAENYWPAIAINHLKNGIHAVEQLVNGAWVPVAMNSDMGQAYILQGGVSQFQIRIYDANDQLINGGRTYSFSFPVSCGGKCKESVTQVSYSIQ